MIVVEREIRAAPTEVWPHLSALDRWHELLDTVDGVERLDGPGPIGVGSRFRVRQPGLATAEYEVVDWRTGEGFTWVARAGGIRTEASHELRPSGAGTRIALAIAWTGPLAWIARIFFSGKARGYMRREAAAFAALAEHGTG